MAAASTAAAACAAAAEAGTAGTAALSIVSGTESSTESATATTRCVGGSREDAIPPNNPVLVNTFPWSISDFAIPKFPYPALFSLIVIINAVAAND